MPMPRPSGAAEMGKSTGPKSALRSPNASYGAISKVFSSPMTSSCVITSWSTGRYPPPPTTRRTLPSSNGALCGACSASRSPVRARLTDQSMLTSAPALMLTAGAEPVIRTICHAGRVASAAESRERPTDTRMRRRKQEK
eukprot:scaffold183342_cov32-Tisochrysis_lutea.AAC.2